MGAIGDRFRALLSRCDVALVPMANRRLRRRAETRPEAVARDIEGALVRALDWFKGQDMLEISALMVLDDLRADGLDPRLDFVEDRIARYRRAHPGFRERLFDKAFPHDPTDDPYGLKLRNPKDGQVFEHPLDTIMRRCLYADRLGLGAEFIDELRSLEDGGGYGTTHIVVGGRLLKRFSAIDHAPLEAAMQETAPRIAAIQRTARSGDIFAERIVVLHWLGRRDLIDPAWLMRLLDAQLADGGWAGRVSLRRPVSNQHTAALAIAALMHYRQATGVGDAASSPRAAQSAAAGGPSQ